MPSNRGGTRERRPAQGDQPEGGKVSKKSPGGPSGDATPRYGETTTATPKDGSDGEDVGMDYTTEQGALEGFDDNRNGFRKFFDGLSGRPSMAGTLNAQLALGRDTTAQQLQSALALGKQSIEGNRQTQLAVGQQGYDLKKREIQDAADRIDAGLAPTPEHMAWMESNGFAQTPEGRARAMAAIEAERVANANTDRNIKQNTALNDAEAIKGLSGRYGMTPDAVRSGVMNTTAMLAGDATNNAAAAGSNVDAARKNLQLGALNTPGSDQANAARDVGMWQDLAALGTAKRLNTTTVNPQEGSFLQQYGKVWPTTATFGSTPAGVNAMGMPDPNKPALPPRQVVDASSEARAAMANRSGYGSDLGSFGVPASRGDGYPVQPPMAPQGGLTPMATTTAKPMFDFSALQSLLSNRTPTQPQAQQADLNTLLYGLGRQIKGSTPQTTAQQVKPEDAARIERLKKLLEENQ